MLTCSAPTCTHADKSEHFCQRAHSYAFAIPNQLFSPHNLSLHNVGHSREQNRARLSEY